MRLRKAWKTQHHLQPLTNNLILCLLYVILPLILLFCYFSPYSYRSTTHDHFSKISISVTSSPPPSSSSSSSSLSPLQEEDNGTVLLTSSALPPEENRRPNEFVQELSKEIPSTCDYTNGEWIKDETGPLYNGSSCVTIKDGQNCMSHGRPDKDYLFWKWKPEKCDVPRFDPQSLLRILQGKHLAFVGDSLARNQLESLLCMLASISPPHLVYSKGANGEENKFRRWHFPSHNVVISVYWSPFLVKGVEKSGDKDYNKVHLDVVDERWASELDSVDMVVLSIGQWYLLRAAYLEGNSVLGCHSLEGINCTETEFYDMFRKALTTSLNAIIQRNGLFYSVAATVGSRTVGEDDSNMGPKPNAANISLLTSRPRDPQLQRKGLEEKRRIDVVVTTFSPHHFEGDWDKFGACSKIKPYTDKEIVLEGMNDMMRQIAVQEVEKAKDKSVDVRIAALDVTKLSLLRPDGHPGPYMYYRPFAEGVKDHVHNDCVHWCLPGPIDTWNEIMLDIIKRWHVSY